MNEKLGAEDVRASHFDAMDAYFKSIQGIHPSVPNVSDQPALKDIDIQTGVVEHQCGARSSKVPKFSLIPYAPQCALAARFEMGGEQYGDPWQYRKGLGDKTYTIDRLEHVINHAKRQIAILTGEMEADGEDHAAAIMWGGVVAWESVAAGIK